MYSTIELPLSFYRHLNRGQLFRLLQGRSEKKETKNQIDSVAAGEYSDLFALQS